MVSSFLPVTRLINPEWNAAMHWNIPPKYFFYPYLLVSPFVTGMTRTRASFGPNNDKLKIYADSGGYQVVTQNKKVSALDVLAWQEKIADVGFTLDVPPLSYTCSTKNYNYYPESYFQKCMVKSIESANMMMGARDNPKMQLWAVIQGKNSEEITRWYKEQTKYHEFEGYVIAITAAVGAVKDTFSWIGQLQAVTKWGTNVHFLGRSEPLLAIILAKLSRVTGKHYTYDTSSAVVGPRFGKYYDPYFHTLLWLSKDKEKRPNITSTPCDCPVCSKHSLEEIATTQHLITLHNVYCIKRFCHYANVIAEDDDLFDYAVNHFLTITKMYKGKKEEILNQIKHIIYGEKLSVKSLEEFW